MSSALEAQTVGQAGDKHQHYISFYYVTKTLLFYRVELRVCLGYFLRVYMFLCARK